MGSIWRRSWWPWRGRANRRTRIIRADGVPAATVVAEPTRPSTLRRQRPPTDWRRVSRHAAVALTVVALGAGGWGIRRWLLRSPHFAVREVRLSPIRHADAEALRARTGVVAGDNLFAVDLGRAERDVQADPWVRRARVRRELPDVLAVDVEEHTPAVAVALGAVYLAEASGEVFKRATVDEAAALPLVTGVARDGYVDDREASQALVREAVAALELWRERADRPELGEIHVDAALGVTLYLVDGGVGVRLGRAPTDELRARLGRLEAVRAALAAAGERPQMFHLDQRTRPDRVTVRLASRQ